MTTKDSCPVGDSLITGIYEIIVQSCSGPSSLILPPLTLVSHNQGSFPRLVVGMMKIAVVTSFESVLVFSKLLVVIP
ncbi:hypothetical protein Droror1_Dr00007540 [Drosera rotundifolia]